MSIKKSSLIKDRKMMNQITDFTGVSNGRIHPSDIDAVMEFDNKVLILIEVKKNFVAIPMGQKILLERISSSWHTPEKSIVIKVEHDKPLSEDIVLKDCKVTRTFYKGKWATLDEPSDLILFLNKLGERWECKKCKF